MRTYTGVPTESLVKNAKLSPQNDEVHETTLDCRLKTTKCMKKTRDCRLKPTKSTKYATLSPQNDEMHEQRETVA